jgi:hypothetical protein
MTTPNALTIYHKGHKIMMTIQQKTDITITRGDEEFTGRDFIDPARAIKFAERRITDVMTNGHRQHPRPAGMSYDCDNFLPNLDYQPGSDLPRLLHCPNPASYRMVIQTPGDCYAVKRCTSCSGELRTQAFVGATFEILEDEPIGDVPFDGRPYYSARPVIDESETYF